MNRKQCDIRLNIPRSLATLEAPVHALIHKSISRGSVTGAVRVMLSGEARRGCFALDEDLATEQLKLLRAAGKRLGLADDLSLHDLMRLPDVLTFTALPEDAGTLTPLVKKAATQALKQLVVMRTKEGAHLDADLRRGFNKLLTPLRAIEKAAPGVSKRYAEQLRRRLKTAGLTVSDSDPQMARELALFADRCDISEEVVRLASHFKQVDGALKARRPVGRELDFLCQGLFREINTIGSKANNAVISKHVVRFKAELERVREQVQNVE